MNMYESKLRKMMKYLDMSEVFIPMPGCPVIAYEETRLVYNVSYPSVMIEMRTFTNLRSNRGETTHNKETKPTLEYWGKMLDFLMPLVEEKARAKMLSEMTRGYLWRQHGISWGGVQE